ncbi:MAG TPA: YidC/Oxa1 family membrane protein insertase [Candidatus Limnocylindria bacterium]|nr:YidC/Oxa1 family membrane protein insertase [Candidatus Limnocylindria bacterium]
MRRLRTSPLARTLLVLALLLGVALVIGGCEPITSSGAPSSIAPGVTAAPTAAPSTTPAPTPLIITPAPVKADPVSLLAVLFNPIFQAFLILMVGIHQFSGLDMGISIIITTLIVRTLLVPLMRRQMVSMRRMQSIQPEMKEIQRKYKGDRLKQQQAQAALMKDRGISQAGCLVALLPMLLILPMYQVVREGLSAADLTASLTLFGFQVVPLTCPPPLLVTAVNGAQHFAPCISSEIPWLAGIQASSFGGLIPFGFTLPLVIVNMTGISLFAIFYTVLQLIASRMALPPHDPNVELDPQARTQRTMAIYLPLITVLYGEIIPVGVFLYLIVSTLYQIVQQFLTTGWGGMFPLFGRTPAFAVDHSPRFPVAVPSAAASTSRPAGAPARSNPERSALDRSASADATIRHRGRQGRRGRRR